MKLNELFHKWIQTVKQWWEKGIIQRTSRITYDVIWNIILFFIVIGVIGLFFVGGVGAGYFASLVKDEPVRSEEDMTTAIYNYSETSEIYFDNDVFMGEISSDLYREEVELTNVSDWVQKAVIATEDAEFEEHHGVVPKAVLRAMFQEVTNSAVKTGGSTLTQQIIKNQILTNEVSFERKAKEILLAMRAEQFLSKDEILQAYLNIVPFGRNANGQNIAGVQTAAQGIFGVDAKDLNLPQAAFIAGLPQSPFAYTPFQNGGKVKDEEGLQAGLSRMKTVLSRMLEAGYINQDEFDEAINYDVAGNLADSSSSAFEKYPYLTNEIKDRAAAILQKQLAVEDGYTIEDLNNSEDLSEEYSIKAERALSQGGYKINTTINQKIYDKFQEVTKDYNNFGVEKVARNEKTNEVIMTENEDGEEEPLVQPVQAGSVLIENSTGKIISFVGGRDFDIAQLNHATQAKRSIGSTAKPILVYAPAMDLGKVQPGSIIADLNVGNYSWLPSNYSKNTHGLVTARKALTSSYNIPAAKVYQDILPNDPVGKYFSKMGFSNITPGQHEFESMALGTFEATVEENVNAFSTFGNDGNFVDAYIIESIENIDGDKVYQHESKPTKVFSPQTNYLILDMMRDVLTQGTATTARAYLNNPGVDWAGKTGTGNSYTDGWFVATNPNVSLGTWIGYDYKQSLDSGYSGRNQAYWAKLVNAATAIDPELMAPSKNFNSPGGIVSRSFCKTSGLLATNTCSDFGLVGSDIYNAKYVPTKKDNSLIDGRYVEVNGKAVIAGENTPKEFVKGDGVAFNPEWLEENGYDKLGDLSQLFPRNNSLFSGVDIPASTDEIKNDGKAPGAPTSLSKSGKQLTWKKSSSNDVVGYRVYRAANPDSKFNLIGNTIKTSFSIGNSNAVYQVKAVDYFGKESNTSKALEVGDFSEPKEKEKEEKEKSNDKQNDKKKKQDKVDKNEKKNNEDSQNNEQQKQEEDKPDNNDSTDDNSDQSTDDKKSDESKQPNSD
ncbi:transglycosylase domain-containing protein [Paraliobacillus ryukyuensis]|uniref:transglycosylase domain-containing protein n=1 Tax=Paraliobacillus ryukyuensis TaxID=200904 RepID=UPI0009A7BFC7|nr:transglycosylase domain-containing protein [Paraliobacillus ryukyuensis]